VPIGIAWLSQIDWKTNIFKQLNRNRVTGVIYTLLPLAAYLLWRYSVLGRGWKMLQGALFSRGLLSIESSIQDWTRAFQYAIETPSGMVYFGIEVFAVALALAAAIWLLRRDPQVALFSLSIVVVSVLSGIAVSMARYVLVVPATYIFLAQLGRKPAFDRVWTVASILLMGMSVMLFSFDMWTG